MNGFLTVLLNTLKNKVRGIVNRARMWTSASYIRTRFIGAAQKLVNSLTSFKPKSNSDYYTIGVWQVAKKLAYVVVVIVGILCLVYVSNLVAVYRGTTRGDAIKTYPYNSVLLKFVNEECRITARSKYVAYRGQVSKGACNGQGTLYRSDGTTVYVGEFAKSKFNGQGKSYYPNQNLEYDGDFVDNLFSGSGTLYRENGSLEYIGEFLKGMKDGHGILHNAGGNPIYEGTFSCDHIVYSELVGKKNSDISTMYTGQTKVYEQTDMDKFVIEMDEIDALYSGFFVEDALSEEVTAGAVYVLKDTLIWEIRPIGP